MKNHTLYLIIFIGSIAAMALHIIAAIDIPQYASLRIDLRKNIRIQLDKIIDGIKCPYDFQCCKSNFKYLCKAQDIGMESFLKCLEKESEECVFSMSLADLKFCSCPLRVYIAKVLKR